MALVLIWSPRDSDLIGVMFARFLDLCRKRQYVYLICVLLYIYLVYCTPGGIWALCVSDDGHRGCPEPKTSSE